jgi:hypothetical protein
MAAAGGEGAVALFDRPALRRLRWKRWKDKIWMMLLLLLLPPPPPPPPQFLLAAADKRFQLPQKNKTHFLPTNCFSVLFLLIKFRCLIFFQVALSNRNKVLFE